MAPRKHIVWDWNGTLYNDTHAVSASLNAAAAMFGRGPFALDTWRTHYARPLRALYERLLEITLDDQQWYDLNVVFSQTYQGQLSTCGLAVDAYERLRAWQDQGNTQSLLSMWFHRHLVPLTTELGIADLFTRIDGLPEHGDATLGKAPYLVQHLTAQQLDPADVILIGDVVDDAEAAAHAGANCILVTTGSMRRQELEAVGVPVADSITEALDMFADLDSEKPPTSQHQLA